MSLRRFVRAAHWVVLCVFTILIPSWVEPIALPPVGEIKPVVVAWPIRSGVLAMALSFISTVL
jgi:hypothetical protein